MEWPGASTAIEAHYLHVLAPRLAGRGSVDLGNWAGDGGATVSDTASAVQGVLLTR
ncbi:hypothetical protein [Pseudoduganella violaceinigra]|uniref:hypothetical protein n=1 Tax=Pseudoduganella violaceinigra TaxID=246602 RepID=UPI00040706E5|nr:hypothetical protein [Pseudoduganella violaceinigra]